MGRLDVLSAEETSASLQDLRAGLNADGYDLQVTGIDDKVHLRVVALEGACEDCLVPKGVMTRILAAALQEREATITADDISIAYPADDGHEARTHRAL